MAIKFGPEGAYDDRQGMLIEDWRNPGTYLLSDGVTPYDPMKGYATQMSNTVLGPVEYKDGYIVRGDYRMPIQEGAKQGGGQLEYRGASGEWMPVGGGVSGYDPRQDSEAQGSNERLSFDWAFANAPSGSDVGNLQQIAIQSGWTEPDRSTNDGTLGSMLSSVIPGALAMYGGVNALGGLSGLFGGGNSGFIDALGGMTDATGTALPGWSSGVGTAAGTGGGMLSNIGTGTAFNPATATISDIVNAAVASGGNAVPAGMLTPELAAAAASGATISSLSPSLLSQLASGLNSALGTDLTGSQILSGGLSAIGGLLQGNAASNAAQTSADAQIRAAQIAADAAKFKPVGVTTRFGQSQFTKDAQGNVTGAGYTMPADIRAMQDQLLGAAPGMLNQFTGSVAATAPMGTAAQRAMSLGNQYLATDPLAQAKKYYDEQQAVMATGRERDQANMLTGEFNRGTYGLATGGTSTGMMAANPRLEAMYNAQRQQDLGLAAAATQGGMDYAKFGAGMVGTGGDLLKSMYGTQTASYSPYQTALSGAQTIEGLGQNALDMSVNIGKTASPAQSGQLLATGMLGAAQTMQPANSYSPWGSLFSGAGNSIQNWQNQQAQQQQNQQLLNALNWGK